MTTCRLWRRSSQKLVCLLSFGFIWGMMMLLLFTARQRASRGPVLLRQVLDLGERYTEALAEETQRSSVLLDYIVLWQGKSESTGASATNAEVRQFNSDDKEKCELPQLDGFPHCEGKLKWMKDLWRSDHCYSKYGVDGSTCSFFIYLSEVEHWCPRLPWRTKTGITEDQDRRGQTDIRTEDQDRRGQTDIRTEDQDRRGQTDIRTSFEELYRMMSGREELRWMRLRIEHMAEAWVSAVRSLAGKQNLATRRRKKILLHLGLQSEWRMADRAFTGGPLGELVQWSDLIATLYMLGHDVHISASKAELKEAMMGSRTEKSSCPTQGDKAVELIYIDIDGLKEFKNILGPSWTEYQCMMRVLDSFGTEPAFNHAHYAQSKGLGTYWGMLNLNPQQFYTMFPHTPDNSFLGFVVKQQKPNDIRHIGDVKRQNQALVYGKENYMWKDKKKYLDIIHRYMEVHGTVAGSTGNLPDYVRNHGLLSSRDLQFLLRESKLFVGLGLSQEAPASLEGPAPLEAIANGCAFLNPKINLPLGLEGKPTLRRLTSQNPYAEVFIGQPHVWTVDIENSTEVERAIRSILSQKIEPYLPYEFTCEGMLQRVNAFIENQDFCHGNVTLWPPLSALQVKLADPGRSCTQMCQEAQLICEPSFFQHLNNHMALARFGVDCETMESSGDTAVPAYSETTPRHCVFQSDQLLFSCAGEHASLKRVCPCRDYMKEQVALCKDCL